MVEQAWVEQTKIIIDANVSKKEDVFSNEDDGWYMVQKVEISQPDWLNSFDVAGDFEPVINSTLRTKWCGDSEIRWEGDFPTDMQTVVKVEVKSRGPSESDSQEAPN